MFLRGLNLAFLSYFKPLGMSVVYGVHAVGASGLSEFLLMLLIAAAQAPVFSVATVSCTIHQSRFSLSSVSSLTAGAGEARFSGSRGSGYRVTTM